MKHTRTVLGLLAGLPLLAVAVGPALGIAAWVEPAALTQALGETSSRDAMLLSLWTSSIAVLLVLVFGTPLAMLMARGRGPAPRVVEALLNVPLLLPPAVAGLGLLVVFGPHGLFGSLLNSVGITLTFNAAGVVLAQFFVACPFYVKGFARAIEQVPEEYIEASLELGAGPLRRFFHIVLPCAWRGAATGATLSWCRALGEFGATLLFAGNMPGSTQTMPLAIYVGFESNIQQALALSALLLAPVICVLLLIQFVEPRRIHP